MSDDLCAWFHELNRNDVPRAGGKGANLGEMVQAGLPVPPGYVITASAFRQVVEQNRIWDTICDLLLGLDRHDPGQLRQMESRVRFLFVDVPIPAELERSILDHYRDLLGSAATAVAVRSSATAEDLAGASFAGQQETFLNVLGEEALLNAVRLCWSSLFTSQAMFYRGCRGFNDAEVSMAVVVQKMVNSAKSGVSFTVDPVFGNPYEMVIEGVWGLGEGIVSGTITPDHYQVDRDTCELVHEFVPEKPIMFCKDAAGGVHRLPVPADLVMARVLSDDEIRLLVHLGNRIQKHFGCPQDIEWGIEGGEIYLLQSRPITSL